MDEKNKESAMTDIENSQEPETIPLLSFVMMKNTDFPTTDEMVGAIKKRIPEFEHTPEGNTQEEPGPIMGTVDGKICALMLINAPNPLGPEESFIQSAWWWPTIQKEVEARKSHAVVTVMAGEPTIADHALLARLTAAVIESNDAIGVLWNGADAAWRTDMFLGIVNQYGIEPPLPLFVSIKLGRDTEFPAKNGNPAWLGMTFGLRTFGIMEIETRGFAGETPEPMIDNMQNMASYLLTSGPVVNDGDTVGLNEQSQIKIQFEDSTLNPGNQVYRLYIS
ncbi:MAG: DUF4261 domain-containing protein [bacterium]|nr:DUF4261 domain-containing protein [bacterium]